METPVSGLVAGELFCRVGEGVRRQDKEVLHCRLNRQAAVDLGYSTTILDRTSLIFVVFSHRHATVVIEMIIHST